MTVEQCAQSEAAVSLPVTGRLLADCGDRRNALLAVASLSGPETGGDDEHGDDTNCSEAK